jgi:serine/threonine protein kinase
MTTRLQDGDPNQIGRYPVLRRIGVGGMSVVYRGFDPELDRQVALKLLDPELLDADSGRGRARLQREARAMAKVNHPNVVPVFDVGVHRDSVYIAMELIEGQPLGQWWEATPRPWTEILGMFLQAARGLAAAHDAGLIHRDFKPDNVLVGADGRARVLDFGLARPAPVDEDDELLPGDPEPETTLTDHPVDLHTNVTVTGIITGTPAYMAPEQHMGESAGASADQFSFCVALWEALYQHRPYAGRTAFAIADAIIEGRIEPRPAQSRVPGWLHGILEKGLNVKPRDRHASMRALMASIVFSGRILHAL